MRRGIGTHLVVGHELLLHESSYVQSVLRDKGVKKKGRAAAFLVRVLAMGSQS